MFSFCPLSAGGQRDMDEGTHPHMRTNVLRRQAGDVGAREQPFLGGARSTKSATTRGQRMGGERLALCQHAVLCGQAPPPRHRHRPSAAPKDLIFPLLAAAMDAHPCDEAPTTPRRNLGGARGGAPRQCSKGKRHRRGSNTRSAVLDACRRVAACGARETVPECVLYGMGERTQRSSAGSLGGN